MPVDIFPVFGVSRVLLETKFGHLTNPQDVSGSKVLSGRSLMKESKTKRTPSTAHARSFSSVYHGQGPSNASASGRKDATSPKKRMDLHIDLGMAAVDVLRSDLFSRLFGGYLRLAPE